MTSDPPADRAVLAVILGRLAHEVDEDTFCSAVESNELPPVKLRKRELEILKGGGWGRTGAQWIFGGVNAYGFARGDTAEKIENGLDFAGAAADFVIARTGTTIATAGSAGAAGVGALYVGALATGYSIGTVANEISGYASADGRRWSDQLGDYLATTRLFK